MFQFSRETPHQATDTRSHSLMVVNLHFRGQGRITGARAGGSQTTTCPIGNTLPTSQRGPRHRNGIKFESNTYVSTEPVIASLSKSDRPVYRLLWLVNPSFTFHLLSWVTCLSPTNLQHHGPSRLLLLILFRIRIHLRQGSQRHPSAQVRLVGQRAAAGAAPARRGFRQGEQKRGPCGDGLVIVGC